MPLTTQVHTTRHKHSALSSLQRGLWLYSLTACPLSVAVVRCRCVRAPGRSGAHAAVVYYIYHCYHCLTDEHARARPRGGMHYSILSLAQGTHRWPAHFRSIRLYLSETQRMHARARGSPKPPRAAPEGPPWPPTRSCTQSECFVHFVLILYMAVDPLCFTAAEV